MKLNNIILILMVFITTLTKGCIATPPQSVSPRIIDFRPEAERQESVLENRTTVPSNRTDYPYILNNILYTTTKAVPISAIKRVDLVVDPIRYYIITYEFDKYTGGMIAISYYDFTKIEKQLLGDTYANKAKTSRKKANKTKTFFNSLVR